MTSRTVSARTATAVRRTTLLLGTSAALVAMAGPASADVAEGWPEVPPVNGLEALLLLGVVPLGLCLVIAAMIYLPALIRGERIAPGAPLVEDEWIGGPGSGTTALAAPDSAKSEAGGASASW